MSARRVMVGGLGVALAALIWLSTSAIALTNPLQPPPGSSRAFRDGYADGCLTGFQDAGRDGYEESGRQDLQRYNRDAEYRAGFDAAHRACYEEQLRNPRMSGTSAM